MKNIIKLASLLDRAGNFILADKLDKIAQNQENPQAKYKEAIEEYKVALKQNNRDNNPESIISEFNNWCDAKSQQSTDQNTKNYYTRLKYNFGKHAERLKILYMPGNRFYHDNSLMRNIKVFGLETARDVDEFNARWKEFTDYSKRRRFTNDPQTGPTIYDVPGIQQQLAALYNQLKSKYVNPNNLKNKSQQTSTKIPDGLELTVANGDPELAIPDR